MINHIDAEINKTLLEKQKKQIEEQKKQRSIKKKSQPNPIINMFNNPKIVSSITPEWEVIFRLHKPLDENSEEIKNLFQAIKKLTKDLPKIPIKIPQPFLRSFDELTESEYAIFIELAEKIYAVRFFNEKGNDPNSLYRAVGFGFIERLVTSKNPFTSLYRVINALKLKENIQFISPQSQSATMGSEGILELGALPAYFIDQLMRLAEKLWLTCEERDSKEILIEAINQLFKDNDVFRLGLLLLLRTETYEYVQRNKKYAEYEGNLLDFAIAPNNKIIQLVSRILKVNLEIHDFDKENKKESFLLFEPKQPDSELKAIVILKYHGIYQLGYQADYCKSRYPKIYQLNQEKKEKLCSFCFKNEGKKHGCEHNYCSDCLNGCLQKSQINVIKCGKCKKALGNRNHLLSQSQIKN